MHSIKWTDLVETLESFMHCSSSFLFSLLLSWDILSGLWLLIKIPCYSRFACRFRSGLASFKANAKLLPPTLFWKIIFGGCWRELGPRRHLPKQQGLCAFTQQYCTRKTPSDLLLRDTCEIYIGFFLMAASRIWKFYLGNKRIWRATCIEKICKQDSDSCHRALRLPHLPAFFLPPF